LLRGWRSNTTERWTNGNKEKMLDAQSNIVGMKHMALGRLKALKKKEFLLAALTMSQEEFKKFGGQKGEVAC
jgi:hypothetical protein